MRFASTGSDTNPNTRKGITHMNENSPSNAADNGSKELLLFQMGPVQEFIAQAATPSDLWAGSYLLSDLILAGIMSIPDYEKALIFPDLSQGSTVREAMKGESLIPSIPNRFLAKVQDGETVATKVKEAIQSELHALRIKAGLTSDAAEKQCDQFLQMTWAVLSNPTGNMCEDYKSVNRLLAMRRNVRQFNPWREDESTKVGGRNGPKDFLSGKETALDFENGLGAMNLLKRCLPGMKGKTIPAIQSEADRYLAIIALDGDKMGATLSNLKEHEHPKFSKSLAEFASEAKDKIKKPGVLIYAGGDDVLAAVPAKNAIDTAKDLAEHFATKMQEFKWKDDNGKENAVSASAGIAIGHEATPLLDLVHAAQEAERRAKSDYDRNAIALTVFKRSGESLEWGCNWDCRAAFCLHKRIVRALGEDLSARFPYKLAALLDPYELGSMNTKEEDQDLTSGNVSNEEMEKIVLEELAHVWERSSKDKDPDLYEKAKDYLHKTFEKKRPQDFLNLFLCETFINRQRSEEN